MSALSKNVFISVFCTNIILGFQYQNIIMWQVKNVKFELYLRLTDVIELSDCWYQSSSSSSWTQCAHCHVLPCVCWYESCLLIHRPSAAKLTSVRNPFGHCGTFLKLVQIQGRDGVCVSCAGLFPVHWWGYWKGLSVSLWRHHCTLSDLPERSLEYVRGIDCASGPVTCKIQEMQAVWWLSLV